MNPANPLRLQRPRGYEGVVQTFGNIRAYVRTDGTLSPEWERHELGIARLPVSLPLSWDLDRRVTKIRCHQKLVPLFEATFEELLDLGLWGELVTFGGCVEFRRVSGSWKLSTHAWGIAIDLDPESNARGVDVDKTRFGSTAGGRRVVEVFERRGFVWGGKFSTPDAMHFQFAEGY